MSRKPVCEAFSLMNNEIHAIDPSDGETIERLYKRQLREREEAHMVAILEDAIDGFQRYLAARNEKEKRQYQEAEQWILGTNDDWLFSFENICETLGLDPSYLRRAILSWAKRKGQCPPVSTGPAKLAKFRAA
jgi:truncated hemoglobin YjbI